MAEKQREEERTQREAERQRVEPLGDGGHEKEKEARKVHWVEVGGT